MAACLHIRGNSIEVGFQGARLAGNSCWRHLQSCATNAVRSLAFLTFSPTQCVAPPEAVYLQPLSAGTILQSEPYAGPRRGRSAMHSVIYLVGLVVVIMLVLSMLGLR